MSDQTELFKALVKVAKNKYNRDAAAKDTSVVTNILKRRESGSRSAFSIQSKEIARSITKLNKYLTDVQDDYVDITRELTQTNGRVSETERVAVEDTVQNLATMCSQAIVVLKSNERDPGNSSQAQTQLAKHRQLVLLILQTYLADTMARYELLQSERAKIVQERAALSNHALNGESRLLTEGIGIDELYGNSDERFEESLTTAEKITISAENKTLLEEMNTLVSAAMEAQKKMLEIAKLQQVFTRNVHDQAEDLDILYDTSVTTTENIIAGNELLNKAVNDGFDFRVWVLFFLLMCSFSLLFLDWYD
eukprot:CFRG4771T1